MLKGAGCLMVSLGIESADPEMLRRHKAGVTLDQVRETVVQIRAAGLRAKGLFMMGLPGETEESIRRTSDFVLSLGPGRHEHGEVHAVPRRAALEDDPGGGRVRGGLAADELPQFRLRSQRRSPPGSGSTSSSTSMSSGFTPTPPGAADSGAASGSTAIASGTWQSTCPISLLPAASSNRPRSQAKAAIFQGRPSHRVTGCL